MSDPDDLTGVASNTPRHRSKTEMNYLVFHVLSSMCTDQRSLYQSATSAVDIQEGVHIDKYIPLIKEVITPDGEQLECRLYQMINVPTIPINLSDPNNPFERKPSKTYLDVILRGDEESQLPEKYLGFLKGIVHNDCDAHPYLLTKLFAEN